MSRFNFKKIGEKARKAYNEEFNISQGIQDEVKIFNERFPKELVPLAKLDKLISDYEEGLFTAPNIGSFDESGSGVGGQLQYVESGKYWTNENVTQHDLGKTTSTLTAGQLTKWINTKLGTRTSTMRDMGEAFMEAGKTSGLDPRYLASHAAIESAWGTSNINADKHNFYGIGAFDNSPYASAYDWSDPKDGIIGGAKWIAENYYQKRSANTLTKMNVDYATDKGWARKIASTMKGSEGFTSVSEGGAPEAGGSFDGIFKNPYRSEPYTITSEFGTRGGAHKGIDLQSHKHRVNLYTVAPGVVVQNVTNYGKTSWGNYAVIDHGKVKGNNVYSLYSHMTDPSPHQIGSSIGPNEIIGREGNTGSVSGVTGIHLHLEIREGRAGNWASAKPVNPKKYINL